MKINTALILCAGYGKRLNPLTLDTPKPLLELNNISLLENTINFVRNLGLQKIIINSFFLQDQIKEFINKKDFGIHIEIISDGDQILDTGGGIFNMIKLSNDENFIVLNPDTLWNLGYVKPINEMKNLYFSKKIKNILLVVEKKLSFDKSLKGDFNMLNNILKKDNINKYIFTGCHIINRNIFNSSEKKNFSILDLWNTLIEEKKLFGYESKNEFLHVTNLEIYNKLLKDN